MRNGTLSPSPPLTGWVDGKVNAMTTHVLEQSRAMTADWRDFVALTEPRVMTLVVFTGLCGLLAAPTGIHPVLAFTAILCIALGAGAAAALNQWYEADIDALMKRTAKRLLPRSEEHTSELQSLMRNSYAGF